MSKTINLKPFSTGAIVLLAFAVLSIDSTAKGQSTYWLTIRGRVATPNTYPPIFSDTAIYVQVSKKGQPEYYDTSGLSFPVTGKKSVGGWSSATLTSTEVMSYYQKMYLDAGYYIVGSGSPCLQRNCFGYATERNLWLTNLGFETVLKSDYMPFGRGKDLGGTIIFEIPGHAVVVDSTVTMVNGEMEYKVVSSSEKNGASGIYGKNLSFLPGGGVFDENEVVKVSIWGGAATGFWKKK